MPPLQYPPKRIALIIFRGIIFLLLIGAAILALNPMSPSTLTEKQAIQQATEFLQAQGMKNIEEYPVRASETDKGWAVFFLVNPNIRPSDILVRIDKQTGEISRVPLR